MKHKFLKSITMTSALVCTAATLSAHTLPMFYVGGKIGYGKAGGSFKASNPADGELAGGGKADNFYGNSLSGGINFGFGYFIDCNKTFYLGLEGIADYSRMEAKREADTNIGGDIQNGITNRLKRTYTLGAAVKAGAVLNQAVMPYLKIGVVASKWKLNSKYNNQNPVSVTKDCASTSKHLAGLLLGVGVDIPVTDCVDVGMEVTYTKYRKLKLTHQYSNNPADVLNVKVSPSSTEFHVTAKYKFNASTA